MKILYVPEAIRAALKAAANHADHYLKLNHLVNTLSADDVALYIYCNSVMETLVPADIVKSFDLIPFEAQLDGAPEHSEFAKAVKEKLQNLKAHQPDLKARFATGALISDLLDDETVRLTHFDGVTEAAGSNGAQTLYERIIQQMYSFIPFEKLAALPVMAGYLAGLQKKVA